MKEAKAPDLNAPRFRKKVSGTLSKQFIKDFKESHPELKKLPNETIISIIRGFNKLVRDKVINYRDGVELPEQLGHIFIGSCRPMKSNVDFRSSAAYLKKIQHRNWESDERIAKIFYTTSGVFFSGDRVKRYRFKHQELWGFTGSREFTRSVSKAFPDKWKMYVEVDPTKKMKFTYKNAVLRNKTIDYEQEILETYNPFEE